MSDKADKKTDTETMAEMIAKGISDGMLMAKMAELEAANKANAKRANRTIAKCPKCRQRVDACGGPIAGKDGKVDYKAEDANHVKMVVLPDDPEDIRFFQGLQMNGVTYLSSHHGHAVLVPKKNDLGWQLANFKRNERDQRRGRKASHNSGSIGGRNAKGFNPATTGWR